MSSSPRLIVLLLSTFVFLGASLSHAFASELTLTPQFQLPGLTFYNALTFHTPDSTTQTLFIEFSQVEAINIIDGSTTPTPTSLPTQKENIVPHALSEGLTIEEIIPSPTPTPTNTPTPTPTSTPTPTPTETPTPTPQPIATSSDLESLFGKYAGEYSVDKEQLKKIAKCESSFNARASYMDYGGMFQFASSSWITTRTQMNQDPNPDLRFNAEEAIKTAAFKISRDGASAWPSCS